MIISLLSACTTTKRKGDVNALGKAYHNTTARYNGYFNANVLLTESIAKLDDQHVDNYTKILDVFKYAAVEDAQTVAGDLDEAIKKSSVVITLHRPGNWTDDSYLLIAKSQYIKKDFESAEETILYMLEEFSPEAMADRARKSKKGKKGKKKTSSSSKKKSSSSSSSSKKKMSKKEAEKARKQRIKESKKKAAAGKKKSKSKSSNKKKEKPEEKKVEEVVEKKKEEVAKVNLPKTGEKPDKYFLKHKPAFQEGRLWLAKIWIERDNLDGAEQILKELEADPKTFKSVRRELGPTQAYLHLKRKEYAQAIPPLKKAIKLAKNRKDKARYEYIIGQIYQEQGDGEAAYASFKNVLKCKPAYEMEFSSRLNLAQNAWVNGKASEDEARQTLKKMLKDTKNKDYKDQIYFALADIDLKSNNKEAAIDNLLLSLQNNASNKAQKAESYLLLAELFFENENYVNAKNYYDSTLLVLANTDERFDEVQRYSKNLTEIAANIQIINLQDSLLAISKMSKEDQMELALKIKAQEPVKNTQTVTLSNPKPVGSTINRDNSTFFAYDIKNARKGRKDFIRKWGVERKLEDNWRRSSNKGIAEIDEGPTVEEETSQELSDAELERIFADVPKTEDDIVAANKAIEKAMFALGSLYRDRLENDLKSIETLEDGLLQRYPETEHELDAWYYLYLSHDKLGNSSKAKMYFDKIVAKYPNSTYARVLKDPTYLATSQEEDKKLNIYYDQTFNMFEKGQYQKAFDRIAKVDEQFTTNPLKARFALLNAMCLGNIKGKNDYVTALKEVVAKYPDTDEEKRAKEIIRLLGGKIDKGIGTDETDADGNKKNEDSVYKLEDEKVHYIIVVLDGKSMKLNDAKIAVADYNREYHKLDRLRISNIYLGQDTDTPILVIRRFKDKTKAMAYYQNANDDKKNFMGSNKTGFEIFAVNQYNYRQILKSKSLDGYRDFFLNNY